MHLPRYSALGGLFFAFAGSMLSAADPSDALVRALPADTPVVVHVRNLPALRENWQHTPFARMWQEPDVQKFFAPALAQLSGEDVESVAGEFKNATGLTLAEFGELFQGELIFALLEVPEDVGEDSPPPRMALGAHLGENRAKLEAALQKVREKEESPARSEEFQGETINIVLDDAEDGGGEDFAWAVVNEVLWIGSYKDVLQETIARVKQGGGESLATAPAFASVYQRDPGAQVALFVNVEPVVQQLLARADAEAENSEAEGDEDEEEADSGFFGLSNSDVMRALGFEAFRTVYLTGTVERAASIWNAGLTWNDERGIIKLLAYGDGPAPQPAFVSDAWYNVSAARFSLPLFYQGLKEMIRDANPMFEVMIQQQIVGINQALGIDLERDFIGGFGDEIMQAADVRRQPDGSVDPLAPVDQLMAVSLKNSEAFSQAIDSMLSLAPPVVRSMIVGREYLGQTIHTFTPPAQPDAPSAGKSISYVITQDQFLLGIGSAAMIETALQAMNGTGRPIWTLPEVSAAIAELPPGGSSINYSDMRRGASLILDLIAGLAGKDPDADGIGEVLDLSAAPSAETVEKHWSWAASAIYREANGLRGVSRLQHVE